MWAKDRQISILGPLNAYAGPVGMVTITAPGADVLPWACAGEHDRHSGLVGCRVDPVAAERWNDSAAYRFRRMWLALRNELRLEGTLILAKVWEPQARGVGHLHQAVPLEHHAAIVGWLKAHAGDFGFGFVDGSSRIRPGASGGRVGAYLASYLGSAGKVDAVIQAISDGVIPARSFFVAPAISGGLTMRALRLRRRAWCVLNAGAPVPMWASAIEWGSALRAAGYRPGPPGGVRDGP